MMPVRERSTLTGILKANAKNIRGYTRMLSNQSYIKIALFNLERIDGSEFTKEQIDRLDLIAPKKEEQRIAAQDRYEVKSSSMRKKKYGVVDTSRDRPKGVYYWVADKLTLPQAKQTAKLLNKIDRGENVEL